MVKNWPANAGDLKDMGSVPGWARSPEERHGNPLKHSCLENSTDRGVWWATVHGVTKELDMTERLSTLTNKAEGPHMPLTQVLSDGLG